MGDQRSEPLKLYSVLPRGPMPWKTQADYWSEQKQARRVHIAALVSVILSTAGAVGASVGAMAVMSGKAPVLPDVVRVECAAPATPMPTTTTKGGSGTPGAW